MLSRTNWDFLLARAGEFRHFTPEALVTWHQTGVAGSANVGDGLYRKLLREEMILL